MKSASEQFKTVLMDMKQDDVFNLIWLYDQYVCMTNEMREETEEYDISPMNIEDFYHQSYKKDFKLK